MDLKAYGLPYEGDCEQCRASEALLRCKAPSGISQASLRRLRQVATGDIQWIALETYDALREENRKLKRAAIAAGDRMIEAGDEFASLTVLRPDHAEDERMWVCKCSCGNTITAPEVDLLSDELRACGSSAIRRWDWKANQPELKTHWQRVVSYTSCLFKRCYTKG